MTWFRAHAGALSIVVLATVIAMVLYVEPLRPTYLPEFAGIVESIGAGPGNTAVYKLSSGQEVAVPQNQPSVGLNGGLPHIGDLMIAGRGGRYGVWIVPARLSNRTDVPPGCFALDGFATDEGDSIRMDNGLTVRKAAGFEVERGLTPLSAGDRYAVPGRAFCLNEEGLITSYN